MYISQGSWCFSGVYVCMHINQGSCWFHPFIPCNPTNAGVWTRGSSLTVFKASFCCLWIYSFTLPIIINYYQLCGCECGIPGARAFLEYNRTALGGLVLSFHTFRGSNPDTQACVILPSEPSHRLIVKSLVISCLINQLGGHYVG